MDNLKENPPCSISGLPNSDMPNTGGNILGDSLTPHVIDYNEVAKEIRNTIWLFAPRDLSLSDCQTMLDAMMTVFINKTS